MIVKALEKTMAELGVKTVVHLVGSVPLSDSETVFKTLVRQ